MREMILASGDQGIANAPGATSMFHLGLIEAMQAEREREIQAAIQRRRLLRPQDESTEPKSESLQATKGRNLAIRVRPTEG
jgi:hypothetical protein